MNNETPTTPTTTAPTVPSVDAAAISPHILSACRIATGQDEPSTTDAPIMVRCKHKDLNAKGRGPHWYRLAWRNKAWVYLSSDRLPSGTFLASDRRCTIRGEAYHGEILAQHDYGGPVDAAYLVAIPGPNAAAQDCLISLAKPVKLRDGSLRFELPDGSHVCTLNPRNKP